MSTQAANPAPLVPAEVDLRDFEYMPLDVRTLRDSKFASNVEPEAFRAGVLLWCAAWHQVPAGSLPNDDRELSTLAGFGRVVKEWKRYREEALSKFVLCSDGRLYHAEVAARALAAWDARLRHHYERARDRLRKANKVRAAERKDQIPELTFEAWNVQRLAAGLPPEKADASAGIPPEVPPPAPGIPPETALKGKGSEGEGEREGERKEETHTHPGDSTGVACVVLDPGAVGPDNAPPAPPPAEDDEPPPGVGDFKPTDAGRVCRLMRQNGVVDVNPGHPDLLALLAAGAADDEFIGAAKTAASRSKGFAYTLGMLKRQRTEAATTAGQLHRGPMPTTPQTTAGESVEAYTARMAAEREADRQRMASAKGPSSEVKAKLAALAGGMRTT